MKRIKYLLVVVALLLVMPFGVFAEEEKTTTSSSDDKKVNVYFFRGEGCPHCQDAEEWFDSIKGEYGDYFKIVDYEVWYNEDNATLMENIGKLRNEEVTGVPYIIIGNKSWNGFDSSYESDMINQIKTVYAQDVADRYDVMKYYESGAKTEKKSSSSDVVALIIIVVVAGGVGYSIYRAKKNTSK